jgi:cold shock CspA family protein/ribosome-associated translation inhibitor RaiA
MQIEPEIAFRNVELSPPIEKLILQGLDRLERLHPRLMACRIMVEMPNPRHRRGNLYHVRIDLTVPGSEIVVTRTPPEQRTHEELSRAIREAFSLARTQLRRRRQKDTGRVKTHEEPSMGRVLSLDPAGGFGYIGTPEGREIYFHRTGVPADGFDELEEGTRVRFSEEEVDGSPRAVSVVPTGSPHEVP